MIERFALTLLQLATRAFPPLAPVLRTVSTDSPLGVKVQSILPEKSASEKWLDTLKK